MESTESKFALTSASSFLLSASTLLLAGAILVIGYIVSRVSRNGAARSKNAAQSEGKSEESREFEAGQTQAQAGSGAVSTTSGKRAKKEKKRRGPQQEFSHPWMVGALKGHTAPVLDMNFSSNGKFLASCAEDCGLRPEEEVLDPGEEEEEEDEEDADRYAAKPSPKEEEEDDEEEGDEEEEEDEEVDAREKTAPREKSPTKKAPAPPPVPAGPAPAARTSKDDKAILSRRQRKNRTRAPRDCREDDEHHAQQQQAQSQQQQQQPQQQQQQSQQQQQQQQQSNQQQSSQQSRRRRQQRQQSPKQAKKTPVPREVKATASEQHVSASRKSKIISSQRRELRHLSDAALSSLLRQYTLSGEQLAHLGYPVECSYFPGYAVIISHHHPILHRTPRVHHHHRLDVNAREFVPGSSSLIESEADSGNGSGSSLESSDLESSDSDKSSDICDSSSSSSSSSSLSSSSSCSYQKRRVSTPDPEVILERRCARCFKMFYVNEGGEYLQEERCVYHWGKLRSGLIDDGGHHGDTWECCRGHGASRGCTTAKMHVWTGLLPGYNGPFEGYVRTRPSRNPPKDGNYGVYALDCEMCFTRRGLELAKVTVVGVDGKIVYDALVRPDCDVIDHNTRFSGITAKDLAKATKRLKDVQRDITSFVYAETILIGHGLENDLRALRILHTTVIDTCVAFPHFLGYPYRSSLKTLARTVLRREIQVTEHDSVEDARIAIDLMLRRLQHDLS